MMHGGTKPEEFYYLETNGGRKLYYLLKDDSYIRETKDIPKELLSKIQKRDVKVTRAIQKKRLISQKNELLNKVKEIQDKIAKDIQPKIDELADTDHVEIMREYENYRKGINDDAFKQWKDFFFPKSTRQHTEDKQFLESKKIFNKKDLHDWLLQNHPDKNKAMLLVECQRIMSAAQNCGYIS